MKLAIEKYLHLIFGIALPILYLFFFSDTPIEALKFVFPVTAILFAILIGILNNLVNMIICKKQMYSKADTISDG